MSSPEICTKCIMEASGTDTYLDENGVCNWCLESEIEIKKYIYTEDQEEENLASFASDIKKRAGKAEYDCVIGLSGGVDSSYVAYLAKKMNLNPMCVHFDNGWNSEIAVSNIQKIVDTCGFDLFTYVIDWPEFRDLQRAFLKASVIDIELLSDHAINATMVKIARKHKIKNVLSGSNYRTEHGMPRPWTWLKQDLKNIKTIQKQFGDKKLKDFPTMGILHYSLVRLFGIGGKYYRLLDHVNFEKNKAMDVLKKEFDWQYYGGKHYESVFTKFYQAYILPRKFGINKSLAHTSCLIRNKEISRERALEIVANEQYSEVDLKSDYDYVIKKLGFSKTEFEVILNSPPVPHDFYPSDIHLFKRMEKVARFFKLR